MENQTGNETRGNDDTMTEDLKARLRKAEAERDAALARVAEWRDISTAPHDSQNILGAENFSGWVGEMRWIEPGGWYIANTDPTDHHDGSCAPTHWQPLPEPPAIDGKEAGDE